MLSPLRETSPFYQYSVIDPLRHGLTLTHTTLLAAVTLLLVAVAATAFDRRDLA